MGGYWRFPYINNEEKNHKKIVIWKWTNNNTAVVKKSNDYIFYDKSYFTYSRIRESTKRDNVKNFVYNEGCLHM